MMDKSKSHERYEDRREYPRIVIDSPVNILYKSQQLKARIHDISPDGLQIRTDNALLKKLCPGNNNSVEANAPLLEVTFCLKLFEMDMKINAMCEIYYSNPSPNEEEEYAAFGLKFINFDGEGSLQLEAFITQEMSTF
ncbi:MAG: PilZ domain-containing protein [Proteobacteria bacterium]|nr:PilZ domain-containing protein [Pseudomonadota bacterium]